MGNDDSPTDNGDWLKHKLAIEVQFTGIKEDIAKHDLDHLNHYGAARKMSTRLDRMHGGWVVAGAISIVLFSGSTLIVSILVLLKG